MMKISISSLRECSSCTYKLAALSLLLLAGLLASCNLRENTLLPPDIDPLEYVTSNVIKVSKDHLIRSDNDDAYIYIKKDQITDYGLWYGDEVHLRKVDGLTQRDSLAFAQGTQSLTNTYRISIERAGRQVILDSIPAFATLYIDLLSSEGLANAWVVQNQYMVYADKYPLYPYGNDRIFFDVDGSGEVELQIPGAGGQLDIENNGCAVEALLYSDTQKLQIWFPAEYMASAGEVGLNILDALDTGDISRIQAVYPGFAINTGILDLQTQSDPDTAYPPILHWNLPQSKGFVQEWIRLSGGNVFGWPQGADTWLVEGDKLISFLLGEGKYFLLSPLDTQEEMEVSLDGSLNQIYLQDFWLDLRYTVVSGVSVRLDLTPDPTQVLGSYFNGAPFTMAKPFQSYQLSFLQGGSTLETLPDGNWIEFGFRNDLDSINSARLFRIYRSDQSDRIDFKAKGGAYDAGHYSLSGGFIYSGVNSSGLYLFGTATESNQKQSFPFLKQQVSIQTGKGYISWNDPSGSFSSLLLEYGASLPSGHPWLSGQPYQFTGQNSLLNITAYNRTKARSTSLPQNTFIVLNHPTSVKQMANFSDTEVYPRFVLYKAASTYAHNTFVYQDGAIRISPAFPGYLFNAGSINTTSAAKLRLYPHMSFDAYDWEYYAETDQAPSGMPILNISRLNAVPDTYGVLASQYDLGILAPAYSLTITGSDDFYSSQLPYIRIRQDGRPQDLLFSIYEGSYYRIYPYFQSDTADPWHFTQTDGHAGFYLSSNAVYAPMIDNSPHLTISSIVSTNTRDHIVSLYQAQLNLPSELIGTTVPLGSSIVLRETPELVTPIPHLSAYLIDFRTSTGIQYDPGFYVLPNATRLPYVYIPIPDYVPGQSHRLFFRSVDGLLTEYAFVTDFGENGTNKYIMVGNCAVALVDGPGWFYTTN
jgi:hypothetical protein